MNVIVNGSILSVKDRQTLSYEWLTSLAGVLGTASITYRLPNGAGGTLSKGDRIALADGMVFNVARTDGA